MFLSSCAVLKAESSDTTAFAVAVGDRGQEGQGHWMAVIETLPTMALVDG